MSDWKPGDVAMVTPDGSCSCLPNLALRIPGGWTFPHFPHTHADGHVVEARPLVVIDPGDREQVERLAAEYIKTWIGPGESASPETTNQMQAALREFANPMPPKCMASVNIALTGRRVAASCAEPEGHDGCHRSDNGTSWDVTS